MNLAAAKPNNKRSSAIFIAVLLVFVVGITVMAFLLPRMQADGNTTSINLPLVTTTLRSSDGEDYTVQALFNVEMDPNLRREVSDRELHYTISEIMESMDVDDIQAPEGVDMVNRFVTDELNKRLPAETESSVYAYDLAVGNGQIISGLPESNSSDIMKGLFGRME
jgi:flagellar basal body-associated protein FliL